MTTTPTRWVRLRGKEACAVCGHVGWCGRSEDGTAAVCMRMTSDKPTKNGGWLHRLNGDAVAPAAPPRQRSRPQSAPEMVNLARMYETSVNPVRLARLADQLDVTRESLQRLRIGWAYDWRAWAFPMVSASGRVLGIRLRKDDGSKFAVAGGNEGLFVPARLPPYVPLLICEGPTSTAALLDLEYAVIGRPSCSGGMQLVRDFLERGDRRDVIVFGDRDTAKPLPNGGVFYPGQDGARRLAQFILPVCRSVKVLIPPQVKDPRDWKRAGATKAVIDGVIRATNYVRPEAANGRGTA